MCKHIRSSVGITHCTPLRRRMSIFPTFLDVFCACTRRHNVSVTFRRQRPRWSRGSVLAFGTQFRGFAPGRSHRFVRAKKIHSTPSFGGEVKPPVPYRSFTACKRSLNVKFKSAFRQNFRTFLAHSSTFRRWLLSCGDAWWRKLERLTQVAQ